MQIALRVHCLTEQVQSSHSQNLISRTPWSGGRFERPKNRPQIPVLLMFGHENGNGSGSGLKIPPRFRVHEASFP